MFVVICTSFFPISCSWFVPEYILHEHVLKIRVCTNVCLANEIFTSALSYDIFWRRGRDPDGSTAGEDRRV